MIAMLPLKFLEVYFLAKHNWLGAAAVILFVKLVGLGVTAFIFDVTRDKLMQMAWFRRVYGWFVWARAWAHAQTEPIRQRVRQLVWLLKPQRAGTFLRRLIWLPSARRDERIALAHAARCLDRVGLLDKANTLAKGLSYGDQRRLEIARALAADPSLLILDEPAAGMNHVEADGLSALIKDLSADGLTIIFIEHNVGMVLDTCDHIVVLNFGEVLADGTPEQIAADERVIEAYLGAADEPDADDTASAPAQPAEENSND